MRAAHLVIAFAALALAAAGTARANSEDEANADISGGMVFGKITDHSQGDRSGGSAVDFSGYVYGITGRISYIGLPSPYSRGLGVFAEGDAYVVSPGIAVRPGQTTDQQPDTPVGAYIYLYAGIAAGLALPIIYLPRARAEIDVAGALNTDFYGLSIELATRLAFTESVAAVVAYRARAGRGWGGTEVLDERTRIGFGERTRGFIGIEYTHGYSEDAAGLADLGRVFKGGYHMIGFVIAIGAER